MPRSPAWGMSLSSLRHFSADGRLCFHNIYREAGICNIKGSLNSCNSTTDYQRSFCDRAFPGRQGALRFTFATAAFPRMIAFSVPTGISLCTHEHCSRIFAISTIYGFSPAACAVFTECRFVHPRGAGTDDNSRKGHDPLWPA